jgi:hypothetical protein
MRKIRDRSEGRIKHVFAVETTLYLYKFIRELIQQKVESKFQGIATQMQYDTAVICSHSDSADEGMKAMIPEMS